MLFLSSHLDTVKLCLGGGNRSVKCFETEREALLAFKQGLTDPSERLSSWVGEDCCKWRGVGCNNQTGHVIMLNLRNPIQLTDDDWTGENSPLRGKIKPSLLHLKYLNYLDLSYNDFEGLQIPEFFGMLQNLRYLNLSSASFDGEIPPHLGNLSSLQFLDLSCYDDYILFARNLHWLAGLSSLKYLNLGRADLGSTGPDWLQSINMLPSLLELHLPDSSLESHSLSLPLVNFTSLLTLNMQSNWFNSSLPHWLLNLTSLQTLDLHDSYFKGPISKLLGNLCELQMLDLSYNYFDSEIQEFSGCLNSSLVSLNLAKSRLVGKLPESVGTLKNLEYLFLKHNIFWGSIPVSIGNLTRLKLLDLSYNKMNGSIPESLGQLLELVDVRLHGPKHSWGGVLTKAHLMNLTRLEHFTLNTNPPSSLVFNVTYDWVPPFRLKYIHIENCQVGTFATWLQVQSELTYVILKNTSISGTIPEEWFSRISSKLEHLDLSYNRFKGQLPHQLVFQNLEIIDLRSNLFEGPIPLWSCINAIGLYLQGNLFSGPIPENISTLMSSLTDLYLSWNHLDGKIPSSICQLQQLQLLSLRSNKFSGKLFNCWSSLYSLAGVDISNNSISGRIPRSMGSLSSLSSLLLSNNNLHGKIPSSLQHCFPMTIIDLGGNRFSGNLPSWIGERLSGLFVLRLRSNLFSGNIPRQLCNLQYLHLIDLSFNNFSGVIPKCLNNMSTLVYGNYSFMLSTDHAMVVSKGREFEYSSTLQYVHSIDLSGNNLTGEIPDGISELIYLGILNLSMNHLSGSIPKKIGNLRWLESLDLSQNRLSGPIPQSLSNLTSLAYLNLSYNNLEGKIPTGNQLQTLNDSSIYEGNPLLCGVPLPTSCPGDVTSTGPTSTASGVENHKGGVNLDRLWFFVSVIAGFIVGFWGVCGTLLVKKSWRHALFRFVDDMKERVSLAIALKVARLQRKFGRGNN